MHTESATKENSATYVTGITPRMPWRVARVSPLSEFQLKVQFMDGLEGIVAMDNLIHAPSAGVFAELANPDKFNQVFVEHGAVTWPGEIDLAPDAMYAEIKKHGKWLL